MLFDTQLGLAPLHDLDEVDAKTRHHRGRGLTRGQLVHGLFKLGHKHARAGPTQVATSRCTAVLRMQAGHRGKFGPAAVNLQFELLHAGPCRIRAELLTRAQQNMARSGLRYGQGGCLRLTPLDELEDVKTCARRHGARRLTDGQTLDGIDEQTGEALRRSQAHHAARGFVGRVRVFTRHGLKVGTAFEFFHQ